MNPYHVMGIIAVCLCVFAAVVGFLVQQGVPLIAAFLVVYATVILWMRGMQQRANLGSGPGAGEGEEHRRRTRAGAGSARISYR